MRTVLHVLLGCVAMLAVGCASHSASRADYVRATLPYDSAVLVSAATHLRQENPESRQIVRLDQAVLEHLLRLHVCLSDPRIPEKDKAYAREVLPRVAAYTAAHDLASGFERGKEYDMLPGDLVLPAHMMVRDVVDGIIESSAPGQPAGGANGSQPSRSGTNSQSSAASSRRSP
jgi:hypothetical protein